MPLLGHDWGTVANGDHRCERVTMAIGNEVNIVHVWNHFPVRRFRDTVTNGNVGIIRSRANECLAWIYGVTCTTRYGVNGRDSSGAGRDVIVSDNAAIAA